MKSIHQRSLLKTNFLQSTKNWNEEYMFKLFLKEEWKNLITGFVFIFYFYIIRF